MTTSPADPVPGTPLIGKNIAADPGLLGSRKLTVPEAARAMGVGETKMREIVRRGDIPVIRILAKILILERDLEAYLQGNYGAMNTSVKMPSTGLSPLPKHIQESRLLKKAS